MKYISSSYKQLVRPLSHQFAKSFHSGLTPFISPFPMLSKRSIHARIPAESTDVSILGEELKFRNGRTAKNRFLKAALTEKVSTWKPGNLKECGIPTEELINIYDKWGHGGFGMILTGNIAVDPRHPEYAGNAMFCKENDSPQLREMASRMAKVMKQDGALAVVQLTHAGRQTPKTVNPHPYSCSDVQLFVDKAIMSFGKPIPLTEEQIRTEVIDRFVYAAKVAHDQGFDGVQLHGAHGYLLSQFLSPTTNKRTDKYGGSVENRMRLIREIFEEIRKDINASTGFLVGAKVNCAEFQHGGLTLDDAVIISQMMEEIGFDFVELSGGTMERIAFHHLRESTRKREAFFLDFAEKIRPVFKKSVVYVTGGFRTAPAMVRAVRDGITDGIGLGRPATAEPDLPAKILRGECYSAPDTKIHQDEFYHTLVASNTQMGQMAKRPFKNVESVCDDIADLSHPDEVENFMKKLAVYYKEMEEKVSRGEAIHGVMEYKNIAS